METTIATLYRRIEELQKNTDKIRCTHCGFEGPLYPAHMEYQNTLEDHYKVCLGVKKDAEIAELTRKLLNRIPWTEKEKQLDAELQAEKQRSKALVKAIDNAEHGVLCNSLRASAGKCDCYMQEIEDVLSAHKEGAEEGKANGREG